MITAQRTVEKLRRQLDRRVQEGAAGTGDIQSLASAVGGAAMLFYGLSRRTLGGLALALLGGAALYSGLRGHWFKPAAVGGEGATVAVQPAGQRSSPDVPADDKMPTEQDPVQESSEESFPASDPPAWTGSQIGCLQRASVARR